MRGKKNKKLYLAEFEFVCGGYGQIFPLIFEAGGKKDLEERIHSYLLGYYGEGNTSGIEGNTYFYNCGEVAVKKLGWEGIEEFQQIVRKLSADPKTWG
jgi:hypothetical protein